MEENKGLLYCAQGILSLAVVIMMILSIFYTILSLWFYGDLLIILVAICGVGVEIPILLLLFLEEYHDVRKSC